MNAVLRGIGRALAWGLLGAMASPLGAQPWAPGQEPASPKRPAPLAEARALERLRRDDPGPDLRRRYLQAAHALLQRYWNTRELPRLLLAGDAAQGCGAGVVREPMAYYCPQSLEIAMALDLGRSLRSARGKPPRELLLLELAVLAHEWGHHVNREQGRGPYGGGLGLTVRQEELAADWRTGMLFGWLLREGVLDVDAYTQTANLMFSSAITSASPPSITAIPRTVLRHSARGWPPSSAPASNWVPGAWTPARPVASPCPASFSVMPCGGSRSIGATRSPPT